jgi:membrane protease YdiL (CAAX protease family)
MKKIINWKLFFILLVASVVVTMMVLPYTIALSPALAAVFSPILLVGTLTESAVVFSIFIFFGLLLSKRVGFGMPILEGTLRNENQTANLRSVIWSSIGWGIFGGILIIMMSFLFPDLSVTFLKAETSVATWKGLMASFYGGIGEEIFARLFLMTLFVWILSKIKKTQEKQPTNIIIWISIILSSILFGIGHLPITGGVTAITLAVVLRAILLNGVVSVIFGWLYWKKGLESAMIAHFSGDIVIHVMTPLVASLFI